MEYIINILDSFPSLNKLTQKHNIILELNNKEYNLKKLIIQQETISIKENLSKLLFKVHATLNNKKILIGINHINTENLNFDNKVSITWLEFKKKIENNQKEVNDINLLFYDCIRLKIKILLNRIIPKSDKKIKTNKNIIKFVSPKREDKNNNKEKINKDDNKGNNINLINSCRIVKSNNFLLNSNSNLLKENINKEGDIDENKIENNDNKKKVLISGSIVNSILDKYQNLEIDPQKSISQEYMKDLMIENDCLLTDNNIIENYSYSTSLGDNNLNKKNSTNVKKIENIEKNNNINITDIKNSSVSCNAILQNSLISQNNFNKIIKNILKNSIEEKKINNKIKERDSSFNKNMKIIKENEAFNNNSNTVRKLKTQKRKNKSFNKIENNKSNINSTSKTAKSNSKTKMNLKNKNHDINNNTSISKENLPYGSNTLNDYYNNKNLKIPINEELELEKNNKDISLKEINFSDIDKNTCLNDLLISQEKETNNQKDIQKIKENLKEEEKIKNNEFLTLKKDYDLFYTTKFIKSIKNDLLDLELNLAIHKSISLFKLYNKESKILFENRNELIKIIKNYTYKIVEENKKLNLLNNKKIKFELDEKNKELIKNSVFNSNNEILNQQKIFENIIINKINKKEKLKSIVSLIVKTKPILLNRVNKNNKDKKENNNSNIKLINKSPLKSSYKTEYKSPKIEKNTFNKKDSNEHLLENKNNKIKNSKFDKKGSKKSIYKKNKSVKNKLAVVNNINKNFQKNKSINNLLSYENLNDGNILNSGIVFNKDNKSGPINNIHLVHKNNTNGKNSNLIYYSTARTKFYNSNLAKLK